jgi:hypothetical protein
MRSFNPLASKLFLSLALAAGLALTSGGAAVAQKEMKGGPDAASRNRISEALSKGDVKTADKLLQELQSQKLAAPAGSGSVAYEEIKACGFYPQETRLECVIDIKQNGGYGGMPLVGSFEYVLFCVDQPFFGLIPVGLVTLPMHDGSGAPWQYAVYRDFPPADRLRTELVGGKVVTQTAIPTARARAILAWQTPPTSCNYSPFWGNVVDFVIRFDPIR